ncbi:hypothetical protein [Flavobacterium aciduliphilum]|uniref:Uncharacterized protein n=1 Tax=Flavobacterium aciduliphilum TaxID=1101402 RepID=A0A328YQ94_9FLAO|nr:hypothetical protein [Flavobacterium aciduliphilum]RAR75313.1 hypothetical protein CLV55_1018 [Flavobacterium aciduliphilum]
MKKTLFILVIITLFNGVTFGQVRLKLGDNLGVINSDAALEVESTNKGILFPRMALTQTTSASPLSSFTQGMIVYNTATANDVSPGLYYADGSKWIGLAYNDSNSSNQVLFGTGTSVSSSPNLT